jgi:hypothetical protein
MLIVVYKSDAMILDNRAHQTGDEMRILIMEMWTCLKSKQRLVESVAGPT